MQILPILVTLVSSWLAGWLVKQVPGLDPAQADAVARALIAKGQTLAAFIMGNIWSWLAMAFSFAWLHLRRPGDVPKTDATAPAAAASHAQLMAAIDHQRRDPGGAP